MSEFSAELTTPENASDAARPYRLPYYKGGQGPVLVLLHGFGDSKISFLQTARYLTSQYTVILPAVPGFGETERDPALKYGAHDQARRLLRFLNQIDALSDGPILLGGNSMGGHISAAFALAYPEHVRRLILLDPAGLQIDGTGTYAPDQSPLKTDADFEAQLDRTFVEKPYVPGPVRKALIARAADDFDWLNRVRADLRADSDYRLNDRIQKLNIPTLIVWGDHDQIISPAHAEYWHAHVPDSKLVILKDMGHAPQYERPEETARVILEFLQTPAKAGGD